MTSIIARALHVLAVVIWIGGVAMATMVAAAGGPARRSRRRTGLQAFQAIEHRFVWQARIATIIVGADRLLHDGAARSVGSVSIGASSGGCTRWSACGCCSRSSCSSPSRSFCTAGSMRGRRRARMPPLPGCIGLIGCCSRSAWSRSSAPSRGARDVPVLTGRGLCLAEVASLRTQIEQVRAGN